MTAIQNSSNLSAVQNTAKQSIKADTDAQSENAKSKFSDIIKAAVSANSAGGKQKSQNKTTDDLKSALESGDVEKAVEAISKLPEDEQKDALTKLLKSLIGELGDDVSLLQLLQQLGFAQKLPNELVEMLDNAEQKEQASAVEGFGAVKPKIVDYAQMLKEQVIDEQPKQTDMAVAEDVQNVQQASVVQTEAQAELKPMAQSEQPAADNIAAALSKAKEQTAGADETVSRQQSPQTSDNEQPAMQFTAEKPEQSADDKQNAASTGNELEKAVVQNQVSQQSAAQRTPEQVASHVEKLVDSRSQLEGRIDLINQLTSRILTENAKNQSEFVMQLQPKELGTVVVRMALSGDKLTVNIFADNANTQRLMQSQAAELEQSLKGQSNQIVTVNVQNESFNQMMASDNGSNFNPNNMAGNRSSGQGTGRSYGNAEPQQTDGKQSGAAVAASNSLLNSIV